MAKKKKIGRITTYGTLMEAKAAYYRFKVDGWKVSLGKHPSTKKGMRYAIIRWKK